MNGGLNSQDPYDYLTVDPLNYKFTTISGAEYTAYFVECKELGFPDIYWFGFEKNTEAKISDKRIHTTIIEIIRYFFCVRTRAIIFLCDLIDGNAPIRHILFERWFNRNTDGSFVKHNEIKDDLITSIIMAKDNPNLGIIIDAFKNMF